MDDSRFLPKAGASCRGHEFLRPLFAVETLETHSQKLGAGDLKSFVLILTGCMSK